MTEQTASKVPQIRFKEFDGDWIYKKLKDLTETDFTNGVFNDPTKVGRGYRLINVKDMFSGSSIDTSNLSLVDLDENEFKRNRVQYGDIFFTRSSLVKEGIACSNVNLSTCQDITFDGHLIRMQPCRKTTNPIFLSYAFKTTSSRRQFILGGKTTTMTTIGQSDIAVVEVALPTLTEQTQIGEYFRELDSLIDLHQRKHDKLVTLKKAMLQKMFPQPGTTKPEIRFKGFSESWKEQKLGDISLLQTGHPFEGKKFVEKGILLVRGMNVKRGYLDSSNEISEYWPSITNFENFLLEEGDIVIQMDGALIGKSYAKIEKKNLPALLVQRVTRVRCATVNADFIYIYIQRDFLSYIRGNKTETAIPHLSLSDIRNFFIAIPCKAEQQKIGTYFRTLDVLISQHATQLQKLQQIKSACLEKMFV